MSKIQIKQGEVLVRASLDDVAKATALATNFHANTKEPSGSNVIVWTVFQDDIEVFSTRNLG